MTKTIEQEQARRERDRAQCQQEQQERSARYRETCKAELDRIANIAENGDPAKSYAGMV